MTLKLHTLRSFGRNRGADRGFTLIEVLLALVVMIFVLAMSLVRSKDDAETSLARASGESMKLAGNGLNAYIATRFNMLVTHNPQTDNMPCTTAANCGNAADPGPRVCKFVSGPGSDRICSITSETLRRNSLVPNSFSGYTPYGASYVYEIHISGAAPNWIVNGLVSADAPFRTGNTVRYDLLGEAMNAAGADAGITKEDPKVANGYNGSWKETGYDILNQSGLLAYRAGYSSNAYAAYLRRDGSTEMTGNLNMGGHDIDDVHDIDASGLVQANQIRALANQANALMFGTATAPAATIGPSNLSGQTILALRNANMVRVEDMAGNAGKFEAGSVDAQTVTAQSALQSNGSLTVAGGGEIKGSLTVGSGASSMPPMPATPPGGISANGRIRSMSDMMAPVFYAADSAGGTSSYFTKNALNLGDDSATFKGFALDNATSTIYMPNAINMRTTGNMTVDKDLTTAGAADIYGNTRVRGSLTVDRDVNVGNGIFSVSTGTPVAAGSSCVATDVRTVRASTAGNLAVCVDGFWRTIGGLGQTIIVQSAGQTCTKDYPDANSFSEVECPASHPVLLSGGYAVSQGPPRWGPTSSTQVGNKWVIMAGITDPYNHALAGNAPPADLVVPSCWVARATCARQ